LSFWETPEGLNERLDFILEGIRFGVFSNALKTIARSMGVKQFVVAGGDDYPNICEYCEMYVNKIYEYGMFMPILPKHPHCHHYIDIYMGQS